MTIGKKFAELRNKKTGETLIRFIGPGRDEDALSIGLRMLTHQLMLKTSDDGGFGFGGRYGYGVDFENDIFEMHYDRQDYDCTCGASEPKHGVSCDQVTQRRAWLDARMEFATDRKTDEEREAEIAASVARGMPRNMAILGACVSPMHFERFEEYERLHPFPACSCGVLKNWKESETHARDCQRSIAERPNFTHKPSGLEICWYKYIGRDNEINNKSLTGVEWGDILASCLASFGGPDFNTALAAYAAAEEEEAEAHKRAMDFWTA